MQALSCRRLRGRRNAPPEVAPLRFAQGRAEVARAEPLRHLRLIAGLVSAATVDAGDARPARRRSFAAAMANMDVGIFPLVLGTFAGPETIPAQLADEVVLTRVRAT